MARKTARKKATKKKVLAKKKSQKPKLGSEPIESTRDKYTCEKIARMVKNGKLRSDNDYQRDQVWGNKESLHLIDSILRGMPIPELYLRKIEIPSEGKMNEVIDGKQRSCAISMFYMGKLKVPHSLTRGSDAIMDSSLYGKKFADLPEEWQDKFKYAEIGVVVVTNLTDPTDVQQNILCAEAYKRRNSTKSLKGSEIAFAHLESAARNVAALYSEKHLFDITRGIGKTLNTQHHPFFNIIAYDNKNKHHFALMVSLIAFSDPEFSDNANPNHISAYLKNRTAEGTKFMSTIHNGRDLMKTAFVRKTKKTLDMIYEIFSPDAMDENGEIGRKLPYLKKQPFIKGMFILIKNLIDKGYVFDEEAKRHMREFTIDLYEKAYAPELLSDNVTPNPKYNRTMHALFEDNRHDTNGEVARRTKNIRDLFEKFSKRNQKSKSKRLTTNASGQTARL